MGRPRADKLLARRDKNGMLSARRSPASSLSGSRSPYEALYGTTPKIGHLRRFGCQYTSISHLLREARRNSEIDQVSARCLDTCTIPPKSGGYAISTREEPDEQWNAQAWCFRKKRMHTQKNRWKLKNFQIMQTSCTKTIARRGKKRARRGKKRARRGKKRARRGKKRARRGKKKARRGKKRARRGKKRARRGKKKARRGKKIARRGKKIVSETTSSLVQRIGYELLGDTHIYLSQ